MKKILILVFLIPFIFALGVGASNLFDARIISGGHITSMSAGMRINGLESAPTSQSVTFEKVDYSDVMYNNCQGRCYRETFTFISNTTSDIDYTLIMYLDGDRWETDKFSVVFNQNNMIVNSFSLIENIEAEITVIIYLHDDLDFYEMNKEVDFELRFNIKEG